MGAWAACATGRVGAVKKEERKVAMPYRVNSTAYAAMSRCVRFLSLVFCCFTPTLSRTSSETSSCAEDGPAAARCAWEMRPSFISGCWVLGR